MFYALLFVYLLMYYFCFFLWSCQFHCRWFDCCWLYHAGILRKTTLLGIFLIPFQSCLLSITCEWFVFPFWWNSAKTQYKLSLLISKLLVSGMLAITHFLSQLETFFLIILPLEPCKISYLITWLSSLFCWFGFVNILVINIIILLR